MADDRQHHEVIIIGAGQAGLSLARQLSLESSKQVLVLDRRAQLPPAMQKVGEATVQVSGYYFSKVLELEEHLLREHYMKYNLRFLWREGDGESYEDYSQSYIRNLSNIASYQLDRNKLEGELLRLCTESPSCEVLTGSKVRSVELGEDGGRHTVVVDGPDGEQRLTADWVVDTSGRRQLLSKQRETRRETGIRHGSSFFWVDGLVDIERLTDLTPRQSRQHPSRRFTGHLPIWLATNHFMGEGYWLWVIPLQGRTSIGLVYDRDRVDHAEVDTSDKLIAWICERFPLFGRDLEAREIVSRSSIRDFAHDCEHTIDAARWAVSGEAGRFSDPLYSPGGDLIALHNTMIVDAIATDDPADLANKARNYDQMMRVLHDAYLPSYTVSYDTLGDQEVFTLRYTWELTVYFGFYVFPFINELFTRPGFTVPYLRRFARLGAANHRLHAFLNDYHAWKKTRPATPRRPVFHDFFDLPWLRPAEQTFYEVGVDAHQARKVLDEQLRNLMQLGRWIVAHVSSAVLDVDVRSHKAFIDSIDLEQLVFDPDEIHQRFSKLAHPTERYDWSFDHDHPLPPLFGAGTDDGPAP